MRASKYHLLLALTLTGSFIFFGCTSEPSEIVVAGNPQVNHAPSVRAVQFQPDPIVLSEPVHVFTDAIDPDQDSVTFRYQWFVDGKPVPNETQPMLSSSMLKRGDRVGVEVVPLDGKTEGPPVRIEQVIGNTPPVVKALTLEPSEVKPGDTVRAVVDLWDADQDEIHHIVKWWRNNKVVAEGESQNQFVTEQWNRGDVLAVSIVASDKESKGLETFSQPLTLSNSPPQFTTTPSVQVGKESRFEYRARAVDGEGDPVTYKLEAPPLGMTINEQTGHIQWSVPIDAPGNYHVRVLALDDRGGSSFQEFTLSFPAPNAS